MVHCAPSKALASDCDARCRHGMVVDDISYIKIICAKSSATALSRKRKLLLFSRLSDALKLSSSVSLQEEEAEKEIVSAGNQRLVITGPPAGWIIGSQS